jgi:hypothetical protein
VSKRKEMENREETNQFSIAVMAASARTSATVVPVSIERRGGFEGKDVRETYRLATGPTMRSVLLNPSAIFCFIVTSVSQSVRCWGVGQRNEPPPELVPPETGWTHPCPQCRRRCCASPCRGTPAIPENSIKSLSTLRERTTTHRPDPIRRIRPPGLASDFKDEKRAWLHEGRNLVPVGVEAEGLECVELGRGPDVCVRRSEEHSNSKERELWH